MGLMATRSINDSSLDPEEKNEDEETERERIKKKIISAIFFDCMLTNSSVFLRVIT